MDSNEKTQCNVCFKNFTHEGNLVAHIKSVHLGTKRQRNHPRFVCEICGKQLSSNRSYREHKNSHFRARPFKCDLCSYAAASQMTLRRHVLRQHVEKEYWQYQCVYCKSSFVEPTSYQNHIQHKHPNSSGSFGCNRCEFKTLSSKNFSDHLQKHGRGEILDFLGRPLIIDELDILPLNNYLIEDDLGFGYEARDVKHNIEIKIQSNISEPHNSVLTSNNCNGLKRKGDLIQNVSLRKVPDHGYMMSERRVVKDHSITKIIPIKNLFIRNISSTPPPIGNVPEPCAHVEIESESVSSSIEADLEDNLVQMEEFNFAKDLGKHTLPDGQVDFDLD